MTNYDAIVVGGGLAGSATAIRLARAGRRVVLLEKETGVHHKVCGEFLSYEAQQHLAELGIDLPALGAVCIDRVRMLKGDRQTEAALPFQAMSLSRCVLDEKLLQRAGREGVEVRRGSHVTGIQPTTAGWGVEVAQQGGDHENLSAPAVFLATGKHDLRDHPRPAGRQNNLIGFKMHFDAPRTPFDRCIDLVLFRGGYAGVQRVEGGQLNLSLLIEKERFAALGKSWDGVFEALQSEAPILAQRLEGAVARWEKPLAVFGIPYGYVQNAPSESNFYRIGDQVAVIPSFSGNGMSIALHSAALAVGAYLNQEVDYQLKIRQSIQGPVQLATIVSRLGVHPWTSPLLFEFCRAMPWLMNQVAMQTRLSGGFGKPVLSGAQ